MKRAPAPHPVGSAQREIVRLRGKLDKEAMAARGAALAMDRFVIEVATAAGMTDEEAAMAHAEDVVTFVRRLRSAVASGAPEPRPVRRIRVPA